MSSPLYLGPLLHLRTLPAFADLSPRQLRDLAYESEEVVLDREAVLIRAGETAPAMYLVVDGFVAIGEGAEVTGPGGVVGFLETLASSPARSPAVAETEVVALRIELDALRDVCEQNFPVLAALLRYVATRVAEDPRALSRAVSGAPGTPRASGALDRVERILVLQRAPALAGVHMDALAELAGQAPAIEVDAEEALWEIGGSATTFVVVGSGSVRLELGAGAYAVDLGPGAVPGLVELLAERAHAYRATALEPSVLLRVDSEPFLDVLEDHFELAFDLLSFLTRRLIESLRDSA